MKQSVIITVVLCVLLGTSFTVIRSKAPEKKSTYCCIKTCGEKQQKKSAVQVPYFPMVKIL